MRVSIHHRCADFNSYRAARVKSLFNVDSGADVYIDADLPLDARPWQIGVIVGPSGSGKTSLGKHLGALYAPTWPHDRPIVDAIAPDGSFDDVTAALASVGLGTVPAWLRPYAALSNGEQFRANLARVICEAPPLVVIDEFSSVVDRAACPHGRKQCCYPATTTSLTGLRLIGCSTPPAAPFNGGGPGDAPQSTWRYTNAAKPTGPCLRHITI